MHAISIGISRTLSVTWTNTFLSERITGKILHNTLHAFIRESAHTAFMSTDIGGVEVYVARGVRIQGRTQSFIIGPLSIAGQSTIPVAGKEA